MTASWLVAVSRLRRFRRAAVALSLLLAVAGGLVVAVAAGADRAASAYDRLQAAARVPDGYLFFDGTSNLLGPIERLPQVRQSAHAMGLAPTSTDFTPAVLTDPRYGRDLNRFKFLSGRRPARADEAMVEFTLARSLHLHTGSTFSLQLPSSGSAQARTVQLRVVGVIADPRSFPPLPYAAQRTVYLDTSFLATPSGQAWAKAAGSAYMVAVSIRGGEPQFGSFLQAVEKVAGGPVGSDTQKSIAAAAQKSMHLQSLALWVTAGMGALVLSVLVGQLLLRQLAEHGNDSEALRPLGMTSGQLVVSDVLWVAAVAAASALGATLVAWVASPLFPLGTARVAEPHPGAVLDGPVVLPGVAALALLVVAVGATQAGRLAARRRSGYSPSSGTRLPAVLQRLPVTVSTGVRMALRPGRGRRAIPVRTTIAATAVGVGGVIVAMTFSSSLDHLLATPALYGTSYDADVEMNGNFGDVQSLLPSLRSDPDVAAVAIADAGIPFRSGRTTFGGEWITEVQGQILPTVVSGRLPEGPDEILLGSETMAALHTGIGRTIPVSVSGITGPLAMRVVGRGVLATATDSETLGKGAVVATSAMDRFMGLVPKGFQQPPPGDAFVRFRPGVDRGRAIPALTARLGGIEKVMVTAPTEPTDVANFGQVQSLPQVLAALMAALAAATMAYLLVTGIRRRRQELAILKTLGFVPAQVSAAVAWQATTVAVVAMIIGIPCGVIGGRAVWSAVAGQMGVVVEPVVPWAAILLLVPAAAAIANLVAAAPALAASRISPNRALRDR
ncbi:MAG TPA: ABC transporter permease [Acidimicrobiales bacterium]|nr:ABC transporter permease [Acidimicrobiales bacterium]